MLNGPVFLFSADQHVVSTLDLVTFEAGATQVNIQSLLAAGIFIRYSEKRILSGAAHVSAGVNPRGRKISRGQLSRLVEMQSRSELGISPPLWWYLGLQSRGVFSWATSRDQGCRGKTCVLGRVRDVATL